MNIHDLIERPKEYNDLFAMLRDYSLATLDAAKAAAYYAGIIHTDAPPNGETEPIEALDPIELERNTLLTMPGGWRMSQLQAASEVHSLRKRKCPQIDRFFHRPVLVST
ncbi:MAG: hypothetical protein ACKPHU_22345, partial [Planctomycetaceae bacterium]